MAKKKRIMIVILFLTSLLLICIAINGYSQQGSGTPKKPVADQKQPLEMQPFQNRRLWQAGLVVVADLNADKLAYTGVCPTVVTFKGSIDSNRAMTVHYRFIRSDDVHTNLVALKLEKDEKKEVTYSWELGGTNGPPEFDEWVFLQVVYPTNLKSVSNVINFKTNCTNREEKSTKDNTKQQNLSSPQQGQKGQPAAQRSFPEPQPQGKGPVPTGIPVAQPGQQRQQVTGDFSMMPPSQPGQAVGGPPIPQPGQTGQGTSGMPMIQPGQKGPIPGEPSILPGNGKGPMPGNLPMPQPDIKTSP